MTQRPDEPGTPPYAGPLMRAENLTKIFRSGDEEIVVFDDLNLEVREGEFVALVGEWERAKRRCSISLLLWTLRRGVRYTSEGRG